MTLDARSTKPRQPWLAPSRSIRAKKETASIHRRVILASHLIFTGYGHWLPNDPRGSGSDSLRKEDLQLLGPIHTGRKRIQPPRSDIKNFYKQSAKNLDHPILWFDHAMRQTIAHAIAQTIKDQGYTLHALAACSNHTHVIVRTHKDRAEKIWTTLANAARDALRAASLTSPTHPIWSHRPYKVYLHTAEAVRQCIRYVQQNPSKENLPAQPWKFITPFHQ